MVESRPGRGWRGGASLLAVLFLVAGQSAPAAAATVGATAGGDQRGAAVRAGAPAPSVSPVGLEELRTQRREAWRLLAGARGREAEAVRDLLAAAARLERARDRLSRARRETAAARKEFAEAARAVAVLEAEVARRRRSVDAWLRFLYEEGPVAYLDVLLGAADFYDFTTRLEVLSRIIGQAVGRLREARVLHDGLARRRTELAARAASLAAAERDLAAAVRRAEDEARRREALLADARALLGERAGALERLDALWRERLPSLGKLLERLPSLAWDRVPPDAVEPDDGATGRLRVTLREETVNRWLFAPDRELASLRVVFLPGRVAVVDRTGGEESLRLEGPLEMAGGRVRWVPERLDFLGVPVGPGGLADLAASPRLVLALERAVAPLRLVSVEAQAGRLVLRLAR